MSRRQQEPVDTSGERSRTGARVRAAIGATASLAPLLFFVQNLQEVELHFLWFSGSTRMLWALLASALAGAIAAVLIGTLNRRRLR